MRTWCLAAGVPHLHLGEHHMTRYLSAALLGLALTVPATVTTLHAEDHHDRVYHDEHGKDDHHWDKHEDKAYRMWEKEQHRKHVDFARLRAEDQSSYWAWRHDHSNALLKIDIR
jgi:hypothetical protein